MNARWTLAFAALLLVPVMAAAVGEPAALLDGAWARLVDADGDGDGDALALAVPVRAPDEGPRRVEVRLDNPGSPRAFAAEATLPAGDSEVEVTIPGWFVRNLGVTGRLAFTATLDGAVARAYDVAAQPSEAFEEAPARLAGAPVVSGASLSVPLDVARADAYRVRACPAGGAPSECVTTDATLPAGLASLALDLPPLRGVPVRVEVLYAATGTPLADAWAEAGEAAAAVASGPPALVVKGLPLLAIAVIFGIGAASTWRLATMPRRPSVVRRWRGRGDAEPEPEDDEDAEPAAAPPRPARAAERPRAPHEVLGVRRGASRDEVRQAYLARIRECHPDAVANRAPEIRALATRLTQEATEAFRALGGR